MTKYLFKISNNNTYKKPLTAQINCSKSTMKTQNQDAKFIPSVFIVKFEYISCFVLVFLLLALNNEFFDEILLNFPKVFCEVYVVGSAFWKAAVKHSPLNSL